MAEPRGTPDALMERARAAVLELGQANLVTIREVSSKALSSLAELVDALDQKNAFAAEVAEIRFQAERIERTEAATFAQSDWVKLALLAALRALDGLGQCRADAVGDFREVAEQAATAIPENSSLSFQHARIQDAFRATVDVYGVALLDGLSCANER